MIGGAKYDLNKDSYDRCRYGRLSMEIRLLDIRTGADMQDRCNVDHWA